MKSRNCASMNEMTTEMTTEKKVKQQQHTVPPMRPTLAYEDEEIAAAVPVHSLGAR